MARPKREGRNVYIFDNRTYDISLLSLFVIPLSHAKYFSTLYVFWVNVFFNLNQIAGNVRGSMMTLQARPDLQDRSQTH